MMKTFIQSLAFLGLVLMPLLGEAQMNNVQLDTRGPSIARALNAINAVGGQSASTVTVGTISGSIASFTTYYGNGANLKGLIVSPSWYSLLNVPQGVQGISNTGLLSQMASKSIYIGSGREPSASTADQNTALGWMALSSNTTGNLNTAIGSTALYQNTTGIRNVAIGARAMESASGSAVQNSVAIGSQAGSSIGIMRNSIAIGSESMRFRTGETSRSTCVGAFCLDANSANPNYNNTGFGYNTFTNLTTGNGNTAIGSAAAQGIVSGSGNIFIGADTDGPGTTLSNFLNIGRVIYGNIASTTNSALGGAGLIGINVVTPTQSLEVSGTVSATRFVGSGSGLTGVTASVSGTDGQILFNNNGLIGSISPSNYSSTTGNLSLGSNAPASTTLHVRGTSRLEGDTHIGGVNTAGNAQYAFGSSGISIRDNSNAQVGFIGGQTTNRSFFNSGFSTTNLGVGIGSGATGGYQMNVGNSLPSVIQGNLMVGVSNTASATLHVTGTAILPSGTMVGFAGTPSSSLHILGTVGINTDQPNRSNLDINGEMSFVGGAGGNYNRLRIIGSGNSVTFRAGNGNSSMVLADGSGNYRGQIGLAGNNHFYNATLVGVSNQANPSTTLHVLGALRISTASPATFCSTAADVTNVMWSTASNTLALCRAPGVVNRLIFDAQAVSPSAL